MSNKPDMTDEIPTHEGGRESVDDALAIVESFGPGIGGLNDAYARQVLLAGEVKRLRGQTPNTERTGELLMCLAVVRELTGTQQKGLDETIDAVRAAVNDQKYRPAQAVPAVNDDLRDRLVSISEAIADQDDRAAQAMLREILAATQPRTQAAPAAGAVAGRQDAGKLGRPCKVGGPCVASATSACACSELVDTDSNVAAAPTPAAKGDALDAKRYRLVRRGQHWSVIDGLGDTLCGDDLDKRVDAALAQKEGTHGN